MGDRVYYVVPAILPSVPVPGGNLVDLPEGVGMLLAYTDPDQAARVAVELLGDGGEEMVIPFYVDSEGGPNVSGLEA